MLQLVDNTLMALDKPMPSKEELHLFCELLFAIGIDAIELPVEVYESMKPLPAGRFILNVGFSDEIPKYPGFYRYVCHGGQKYDNVICEFQLNDVREIIKLRTLAGNDEVRITGCDDLLSHPCEKLMEEIQNCLPGTNIHFCPENTFGCASALALLWVQNNGRNITASFAGCNNNAATEEILMTLRLAMRHKPNRDLSLLPRLTKLYERFMNKPVGNRKPIIGKNIFRVEAGIHADAICKNPATYEAYPPESVGRKMELVIGKHSGTKAVKMKLEELKLPVPDDSAIDKILQLSKNICTQERKSLNDEEFIRLVTGVMKGEGSQAYC